VRFHKNGSEFHRENSDKGLAGATKRDSVRSALLTRAANNIDYADFARAPMNKVPFGKAHSGTAPGAHASAHISAASQLKNLRRNVDSGRILFGFGTAGADCVILDISDNEARVRIHLDRGALPKNLVLVHLSAWKAYDATIAWDDDSKLGLKLNGVHDLRNPSTREQHAMSLLCEGH
jgi:hypothetical protein